MDGDIRTLVSVTRQGDFVRSKPDIADEVLNVCDVVCNNQTVTLFCRLKYLKEKKT